MKYLNIMKIELKIAIKEMMVSIIPYDELDDLDERTLRAIDDACDQIIPEWERKGYLA